MNTLEKFSVRNFVDNDYNSVIELWLKTDLGNPVRGDNLQTIKETIKTGGRLLILELVSEKKIIGTSWLTNDGRRIYLHHFGIDPEYQGKGYSKPLLEKSIEFAKQTGKQIKLEVHQTNIKATNLYKKYGFKYLGDYDVYIIRSYL
jgi:ribosomal protein S18 acetylase RimI-like enzyme